MSITADILRGHTEAIILSHLMDSDSYGYQINKDILEKTDNRYELKEATLYTAFRRLEKAGLITTYWGDQTTGRAGVIIPLRKPEEKRMRIISATGQKPES